MAEGESEVTRPGTALVLLDRKQQVDEWVKQHHNVSKGRGRGLAGSYAGREAGMAAGRRANLNDTSIGGQKAVGS